MIMAEVPKTPEELRRYQRIVIDQDICIGCGACVSVCPTFALEMDENGKARLIWERCIDDFSCVKVCPVNCIWETSKAPGESKKKSGWYRFGRELNKDEVNVFQEWRAKFGIVGKPFNEID